MSPAVSSPAGLPALAQLPRPAAPHSPRIRPRLHPLLCPPLRKVLARGAWRPAAVPESAAAGAGTARGAAVHRPLTCSAKIRSSGSETIRRLIRSAAAAVNDAQLRSSGSKDNREADPIRRRRRRRRAGRTSPQHPRTSSPGPGPGVELRGGGVMWGRASRGGV